MSKKILVVDDFNSTRLVIKKTLEKKGYTVFEASDGKEAMKYLDGRKLDLVITDYNMPNMNGFELVEYIREYDIYEFIPIMMLTTDRPDDKKDHRIGSMITAWIRKPFQVDRFINTVERLLRY
jgi:two-component system chemotaxis response regulator CheY